MTDYNKNLITEFAFTLILNAEEANGFEFNTDTIDASGAHRIKNIKKSTVLEFLQDDNTKLFVSSENGKKFLMASNTISNESIKIYGLTDHYLAMINIVYQALKMKIKREKNPNTPLLTHAFIKDTNLALQSIKIDEIAIGKYRKYDLFGNKVDVHLRSVKDGFVIPLTSIKITDALEVEEEMEKLINWVNTTAFKDKSKIIDDIAQLYARLVQTQPFRDGNKRTAKLLCNYILLVHNEPMITIPVENNVEFFDAFTYATTSSIARSCKEVEGFEDFCKANNIEIVDKPATNKYFYLSKFFKEHQVPLSSKLAFKQILNSYGKESVEEMVPIGKFRADQVDYTTDLER